MLLNFIWFHCTGFTFTASGFTAIKTTGCITKVITSKLRKTCLQVTHGEDCSLG